MSYTTDDFSESLSRVGIEPTTIDRVVCAWGKGDGMGKDAGHYRWSDDGATDWSGGFLMHLKAGGFLYLTGWCDYTGWGCQDGAEVYPFATMPSFQAMKDASDYHGEPDAHEWDIEPADLNRWLASASSRSAPPDHKEE